MFNEMTNFIIQGPIKDVYNCMIQSKYRLINDPGLINIHKSPDGLLRIWTDIVSPQHNNNYQNHSGIEFMMLRQYHPQSK